MAIDWQEWCGHFLLHSLDNMEDVLYFWKHSTVLDIGECLTIQDEFSEQEKLTSMWWKQLVAGAVARAMSRRGTAPLDGLKPSACLTLTRREPRRARASGPPAAPGDGASKGGFGATEPEARGGEDQARCVALGQAEPGAGILNLGSSSFHLAHLTPGPSGKLQDQIGKSVPGAGAKFGVIRGRFIRLWLESTRVIPAPRCDRPAGGISGGASDSGRMRLEKHSSPRHQTLPALRTRLPRDVSPPRKTRANSLTSTNRQSPGTKWIESSFSRPTMPAVFALS
ncbi:hypothetical protein Celaphus_00003832 [Cervus elaphus hippelaphus]|uniref:Uncharacterized protein n=1 Tax=Cervus elaphus hippelaphus TaxID=46360 RepID=A0A212D2Q4_CEREH|nr:hypothetical protein Celaphus_00003832 [Cervus elaphus hippelaphus]